MSIDRLRYFFAVVETRNLRRAAELVGISPPSMSKAIAVLEGELDCQLIHPEGRGIGITPKGLEVYRLSSSLLAEYRRFHQQIKEGKARSEQIRLATFEVFSTYFMANFLQKNPEISDRDVLLLEMTPGKIEQGILSGSVDLGITYLPSPEPSLEYREIGAFGMGLYGQKKWESIAFPEWPFAIPTTELRVHSSAVDSLDMWPESAPKRFVKYRFELLETALQTSRNGLSVLHCPDFIARIHNEQIKPPLHLRQLGFPSGYKSRKPTKVYLVGHKGAIPVEVERKFAKFMRLR
jgi:DNA-binding transcriptional LysR family regulator